MRPQLIAYRSFEPELAETRRFADMGVKLRAFGICNTHSGNGSFYGAYPQVWIGDGVYDWSALDRQVEDILKASPDAEFYCLIDLNSPPWLQRRLSYDSFDSIASASRDARWIDPATKWLTAVVTRCEEKWGNRIRAYALMAGQTTEWFELDFSRSDRRKNAAWRAWCAERGFDGGDSVPDAFSLGKAAFEGVIYDPATERRKIEFWRFNNRGISDALLHFTELAKRLSGGKQIGAFFGYFNICNHGLATVGHLDFERVAASDSIDFFSAPATYTKRECGFSAQTMAIPGTLRRHGKRFLHEIDFWPYDRLVWFKHPKYWHTPEETTAGNLREVAYAIVHHASYWWFDQKGGFYSTTPGLHEKIARTTEIAKRFTDDQSPLLADVLVVADPDSAYSVVDNQTNGGPQVKCPDGFAPVHGVGQLLPRRVSSLGVVVDCCTVDDLPHLDLSRVKMFVLPGTWTIDAAKAKILKDHALRPGKTVVWTYAPGVSDGKTLDAGRVKDWSGFAFKTPGVNVCKMSEGWTSVYAYNYESLDPEALRRVLATAGCHFWTDSLPVIANERLFSVHVKEGGPKVIRLPRRCAKVVELMTDRVVAENTDTFTYNFASPDTALFEMK